jgi:hypothetical protein
VQAYKTLSILSKSACTITVIVSPHASIVDLSTRMTHDLGDRPPVCTANRGQLCNSLFQVAIYIFLLPYLDCLIQMLFMVSIAPITRCLVQLRNRKWSLSDPTKKSFSSLRKIFSAQIFPTGSARNAQRANERMKKRYARKILPESVRDRPICFVKPIEDMCTPASSLWCSLKHYGRITIRRRS